VTEHDGGLGKPFCVSVQVDGEKFKGYGTLKVLAKQAAAEAALASFARMPGTTDSNNKEEDDKVPWAALASFAMFKLFKYWREGSGTGLMNPASSIGMGFNPMVAAPIVQQPVFPKVETGGTIPNSALATTLNMHLDGSNAGAAATVVKKSVGEIKTSPMKEIPEKAATMHPVMLLHQLRPGIKYETNTGTMENKKFFHISAVIDDQTFYGEGPNMKKAKLCLARDAIKVLFNIESQYGPAE